MARRKKKSQQMLKRYSVEELDVRPVTSKDKWCYKPSLKNGEPLKEGDWGYIITLQATKRHSVIEGLEGYSIVRSKKVAGQLLLQIVLTCYDNHYAITAQASERKGKKNSKSKSPYILSIRNLQK